MYGTGHSESVYNMYRRVVRNAHLVNGVETFK